MGVPGVSGQTCCHETSGTTHPVPRRNIPQERSHNFTAEKDEKLATLFQLEIVMGYGKGTQNFPKG